MRGQAAIEFISTYGWAIAVMLVAVGALAYFGVFNSNKLLPEKCVFNSGFSCNDYLLSSTDKYSIYFELVNSGGRAVTINGSTMEFSYEGQDIKSTEGCPILIYEGNEYSNEETVTVGVDKSIIIKCSSKIIELPGGDKAKVLAKFKYYKSGGKFPHSAEGEIVANVEE